MAGNQSQEVVIEMILTGLITSTRPHDSLLPDPEDLPSTACCPSGRWYQRTSREEGRTPLSCDLLRWCMSHLALALPQDETVQMEPLVSSQLRSVAGRPHLMPVNSHL
ncbi:unnamed protein product [Fusarium venenatum]|uniref:Uncharacterized protein n=1 Tax=Fusarium venenatum TaxID=56646 RepID=A0A2L2SPH4_9HYPO|nr:uncharacterized protein FVRRES_11082 [Fusarium venenatum]CEI38391.1 unnamed protein product [Fusarium venenatum]